MITDGHPGSLVTLVGAALKPARGTDPCVCVLRSADGTTWNLERQKKKGRKTTCYVTHLPENLEDGDYEIRILGLTVEYAHYEGHTFKLHITSRCSFLSAPSIATS